MAGPTRIRTPLYQHWHRFRTSVLPILGFAVFLSGTLWLWERQSVQGHMVGEVEAVAAPVAAMVGGVLRSPNQDGTYWERFQHVQKGQVIAQLDDSAARARLKTLETELEQLQSEIEAEKNKMLLEQLRLAQNHSQEQMRLKWRLQELRAEYLTLKTQQAADEADEQRLQALLENFIAPTLRVGAASRRDMVEYEQQREVLRARIAKTQEQIDEIYNQGVDAKKRLQQFEDSPLKFPEIEKVLEPIRRNLDVQEALIAEVTVEIKNLLIRAPYDGVITQIHAWPGQTIQAGMPIVTLAQPDSQYVVAYIREHQRIRPTAGMPVSLRLRQPGSPEFTGAVQTVGPQVEPVPPHQLKDPNVQEYGTPVKIPLSAEMQSLQLRPGELLWVIFQTNQ